MTNLHAASHSHAELSGLETADRMQPRQCVSQISALCVSMTRSCCAQQGLPGPMEISLHLLSATYTFPSRSFFYFFCRIAIYDPKKGASRPISVLENQLTFCPEQCYQGCFTSNPNSDAFSPPCRILSLIKPIFCRQPKLLLAAVSSPHREIPFTTVSREAKSLTPNQNKVTR